MNFCEGTKIRKLRKDYVVAKKVIQYFVIIFYYQSIKAEWQTDAGSVLYYLTNIYLGIFNNRPSACRATHSLLEYSLQRAPF